MKTSVLKKYTFLVSLVAPLLLILMVLALSNINPQTQNIEATNTTQGTSSSSISELIQKGNTMLNSSKYEEALKTFDQVLKIDTSSVDALTGKGLIYNKLGRYEEAITWFDKALSIDPNFVEALYNKADALGELGKYEEAIVWTDKALALEPTNQNDSNSNLLLPNE
ncbi:MAG TPA: tetratricopeptide repeat protein [Nitrososphaeraceae archaeon]|jgi:tetratricopeptide (TPR) repeat protein